MMNTRFSHINGYILAGGKSSRMGMDKGLMLFKGKAIIQYITEQMQPSVNETVIVSDNKEYQKFGFEVISDLIKDIGPAGGIYSALHHTNQDLNFIVSCDMPFITNEAIEFLIQNTSDSKIILPVYQGNKEPLFGVYSKACLSRWLELIGKGCIKLQDLVNSFELKTINVDNNKLFMKSFFTNINTKTDFQKAINLS